MNPEYPPRLAAAIATIRAAINSDDYLRSSYQRELLRYAGRDFDVVAADIDTVHADLVAEASKNYTDDKLADVEMIFAARALMTMDDVAALNASGGAA